MTSEKEQNRMETKRLVVAALLAAVAGLDAWIFVAVGPAMGAIFGLMALLSIAPLFWGKGRPAKGQEVDSYIGEEELDLFDPRRATFDPFAERAQEGWREGWGREVR